MASQFLDVSPGQAARVVFSHYLAFFTGHVMISFLSSSVF